MRKYLLKQLGIFGIQVTDTSDKNHERLITCPKKNNPGNSLSDVTLYFELNPLARLTCDYKLAATEARASDRGHQILQEAAFRNP